MVAWDRKVDVTSMTRAGGRSEIACCATTSTTKLVTLEDTWGSCWTPYRESAQAPRAGSYKPPGIGLRRVSKVVGFSILLTDIDLISLGVRKSKSTAAMADATGWEIFMVPFAGRAEPG